MRCLMWGCKNQRLSKNRPIPRGCERYCEPGVGYFRLPNKGYGETKVSILARERRKAWIKIITKNNDGISESRLNHGRVCGRHFVAERPAILTDTKNVDWVPNLHLNDETCCYGYSRKCHKKPEENTKAEVQKKGDVKKTKTTSVSDKEEEGVIQSEENQDSIKKTEVSRRDKELVRCRTCLGLTKESNCLQLTGNLLSMKELRNMLNNLIGPMDLETPVKPVMCYKCEKILKLCHSFKTQCDRIEDSLKSLKSLKSKGSVRSTRSKSKRSLRSSVKTPKRYWGDESPTSISSKKSKAASGDEHEEDTDLDEEKQEPEDPMLVLEDIEKDIKAEIDVDSDIVDLIKNEINNTEDSDIKDYFKNKFRSDPGVKIVPYVIPRQVICVTPNMVQKFQNNNLVKSKQNDVGKMGTSVKGGNDEAKTTSSKAKTASVKSNGKLKNAASVKSKSDEEFAALNSSNDDASDTHERIIVQVEAADDDGDESAADVKQEYLDMNSPTESEDESCDDGKAENFFEDFEPDWFKGNERKRRFKNIRKYPAKVKKGPEPLIVYTGDDSYAPTKQTPDKDRFKKVSKMLEPKKEPTDNMESSDLVKEIPGSKNHSTDNMELSHIVSELVAITPDPEGEARPTSRTADLLPSLGLFPNNKTEKITSKELEDILEGNTENDDFVLKRKEVKVEFDATQSLKTYSRKNVNKSMENSTVIENQISNDQIQDCVNDIKKEKSKEDYACIEEQSNETNLERLAYDDSSAMDEFSHDDNSMEFDHDDNDTESQTSSRSNSATVQSKEEFLRNWMKQQYEDESFLATLHGPKFPCNKCRGSYNTIVGLRRHLKTHYAAPYSTTPDKKKTQISETPCTICGVVIKHSSSMYRHMKRHAVPRVSKLKDSPSTCNICLKTFKSIHSLQLHMRVHLRKDHAVEVYPFKKDKQIEKIKVIERPKRQEEEANNSEQFKCVMCAFKARDNEKLKNHYLTIHTYKDTSKTQASQNTSSEVKEIVQYQCELCDKLYDFEDDLKLHIQTHFGHEEQHEDDDEESHSSNNRLRTLSEVSSGYEKVASVFICSKCGHGFSEIKSLTQHLQEEHCEEQDSDRATSSQDDYNFGFPSDEDEQE